MTYSNPISRGLRSLCRGIALLGGVLLLAIMAVVVVSVTGRSLVWIGLGPIPGDFELVEAGGALAIFCFLPWCQLQKGHVTVDILQGVLGKRVDAGLETIYNLIMAGLCGLIAWRLWAGMLDKMNYGETTFILQFPVWWGYAVCLPMAILSVIVCLWTVVESAGFVRVEENARV